MECNKTDTAAFPVSLTHTEEVMNLASSIANILTAPGNLLENDRYKTNTLHLLRYLIRSPGCKLPSELCSSDLIEMLLDNIFKKQNIIIDPCGTYDILHMIGAAVFAPFDSTMKNRLIKLIIQKLSRDATDEMCNFLHYIWQIRDSIPLYSDTLEELCLVHPLCLETTLLDLTQEAIQDDEKEEEEEEEHKIYRSLQAYDIQSYLSLCSKSQKIFQESMSILHQLLLISNINSKVLCLIRKFVKTIKEQCQDTSFHEFYPSEYHSILIALDIDPELFPENFADEFFTRTSVLKRLVEGLRKNRRATSGLIVLYPKWLPYVKNFCIKNNILDLLPLKQDLWCSDELFQLHLLLS